MSQIPNSQNKPSSSIIEEIKEILIQQEDIYKKIEQLTAKTKSKTKRQKEEPQTGK